MAEPLKIVQRLQQITTDYAVFERDQVLTAGQLNSVTEYLDDQARLTRTQLLGIGIVGGLLPALERRAVVVSAGVGVTSDGDLIAIAAPQRCDRWVEYDENAPAYPPFHVDGQRIPLLELLPADDPRSGRPVEQIASRLTDMVVVAFMESYENDPDLCTGGDCDNRGRTAKNRQRLLLVERKLAAALLTAMPGNGAALAAQLPRLRVARVDLGSGQDSRVDVTSAELFAVRYRNAARQTLLALRDAVMPLAGQVAAAGVAGLPNPSAWAALLARRVEALNGLVAGVQYAHAHARDLVEVWNQLRAALRADASLLAPAPGLFPKHLLLGALADPAQLRSACHPAPWLLDGTPARQRAARLMRLFDALLRNFDLPSVQVAKITPSRRDSAPLGERAIPVYYRAGAELRALWRHEAADPDDPAPGYHWMPTPEQGAADDPFNEDQGAVDFYRIEGLLGLRADAAETTISRLVRQRNLPIAVVSVLAHNERRLLLKPPKFRRTDLHSLHYLLRQDLASHLRDSATYSNWLIDDVRAAGSSIKRGDTSTLNKDFVKPLETARDGLTAATRELVGNDDAPGPLAARTYRSFNPADKVAFTQVGQLLAGTARARAEIGEIARNDVPSPIDAFVAGKTHLWAGWLGDILKKREEEAADSLLLPNLLNEHPGLVHAGGVVPGGTFFLVHDDSGRVIGDLMLPYWIDDNDEADLEEPSLTLPDIGLRLPRDLLPIKVIKPLDLALEDFKATRIMPEIRIQENYSAFFQSSLGSLGEVLNKAGSKGGLTVEDFSGGLRGATEDSYMRALLERVDSEKRQLQEMKAIEENQSMPAAVRERAGAQAKEMEARLAGSIDETTRYFAVDAEESVRFGADKGVVYATLGGAAAEITDSAVSASLKQGVEATASAAARVSGGSSALVAGQMMNSAFRFR